MIQRQEQLSNEHADRMRVVLAALNKDTCIYFVRSKPIETVKVLWCRDGNAWSTARDALFRAIRIAAQGELLLQPEMMTRALSHAESLAPPEPRHRHEIALTERERDVLVEVARGNRSKEIAVQLGITENTVKGHLASIYGKLGVDSRASAVAIALERGLLPRQKDSRMASH